MGAAEDLKDELYTRLEFYNQRKHDRFFIEDHRHWQLKLNSKHCPVFWLNDLSSSGLQIRQGIRWPVGAGDLIQVQIRFDGRDFVNTQATVKWVMRDPEHVNMNLIGLEYLTNKGKLPLSLKKNFKKKNLKACDEEFVKSQITQVEELQRSRYSITQMQLILSSAIPFVAGYFYGFFI